MQGLMGWVKFLHLSEVRGSQIADQRGGGKGCQGGKLGGISDSVKIETTQKAAEARPIGASGVESSLWATCVLRREVSAAYAESNISSMVYTPLGCRFPTKIKKTRIAKRTKLGTGARRQ